MGSAGDIMALGPGTAGPVFFGAAGVSSAIVLANAGAAIGIALAGKGLAAMGVMYPESVMKNIVPVVMAGVTGIYGMIVSVLISLNINSAIPEQGEDGVYKNTYQWHTGFSGLGAGLTIGLSGLGGGYAIGAIGDKGMKAVGLRPQIFVGMILTVSFASAVPLFGLISAMIMTTQ